MTNRRSKTPGFRVKELVALFEALSSDATRGWQELSAAPKFALSNVVRSVVTGGHQPAGDNDCSPHRHCGGKSYWIVVRGVNGRVMPFRDLAPGGAVMSVMECA
jgi:hypothetical protein